MNAGYERPLGVLPHMPGVSSDEFTVTRRFAAAGVLALGTHTTDRQRKQDNDNIKQPRKAFGITEIQRAVVRISGSLLLDMQDLARLERERTFLNLKT